MKTGGGTLIVLHLLYLVIVASMVYAAFNFGGEGSIVPLVIGVPTLVMILAALGGYFFPPPRERVEAHDRTEVLMEVASWSRAGRVIGWLAGFFLLIFLVGFYPSILLYSLAYLRFEGKTSWGKAGLVAAVLWSVIYLSFDALMGQTLFRGIFFRALLPNL